MEGAIKILQFCIEQKEAGFDIWFNFVAHTNWIEVRYYNDGKWNMGGGNKQSYDRHILVPHLTPERADQIINEIKEKLK